MRAAQSPETGGFFYAKHPEDGPSLFILLLA
jgi:hypothetical protein